MISDSFVHPIEPMLASHYNETHIIQPQAYSDVFDIKLYIQENNIGTIVFVSMPSKYWDGVFEKLFEPTEEISIVEQEALTAN